MRDKIDVFQNACWLSYQSVSNNWRHDTNVFMTLQILIQYEAVLIFVGEVLQKNAKNKLIVETPLQGVSKGVALSGFWALDTDRLKILFYICGVSIPVTAVG